MATNAKANQQGVVVEPFASPSNQILIFGEADRKPTSLELFWKAYLSNLMYTSQMANWKIGLILFC